MTLTLKIENMDQLSDGGPTSFTIDGRGFEVGRDPAMDWTLPDPQRFISGRHLDIRFERGAYMLTDVSTNGTFVNGSSVRVKSPYRLENGDRLQIGQYLVSVTIDAAAPAAAPFGGSAPQPFGGPAPVSPYGNAAPFGSPASASPYGVGAPGSPFDSAAPGGGAADIWGAPVSAPPPGGSFDPRPRAMPTSQSDFADQHIEMPQYAAPPVAPIPMAPIPSAPPAYAAPPYAAPPASVPQPEAFPGAQFSQPPQPLPTYPPARPPAAAPVPGGGDAILRAVAEGAGVPESLLTQGDPIETAREIGRALRVATDELAGLLRARAATKQSVRSGSRTMLGAADNNPLKFIPTAPERLDAMFGIGKPGFQRGAEAVRNSFDDVKRHQYAVHAAIQPALARLIEDLSPESVEQKVGGSILHSRKARAWEIFVERWDAKTHPYENGMLDLFMKYFAEAYDSVGPGGSSPKN